MKIDRLVSIIMLLLEKDRIGAKELSEIFEVSPRTIYRDIDAINMAGIPIHAISGVGGGFEIMPNYKIDKKIFSTNDLSAILMGLSSLSDMIRGDELVNALAKVKSFIPADQEQSISLKTNQLLIDLNPFITNANIRPYLEMIKSALQENKLLSFDYSDHQGNKTSRTTEPYQLVLKNSHWYLYGFCHTRNSFRLFKLSRMSELKICKENFIPREMCADGHTYKKPQLDFTEAVTKEQIQIKLRIHKSVMDVVLDYCSYDNFTPDGEDYYIVCFPFFENDYYYNFLLSLGDKCECLQPPQVREGIRERIHRIAAIYDNSFENR